MNDQMIIMVDTNEQTPFFAGRNAPKDIPIMRANIKKYGGDYTVKGLEGRIIIERKKVDEFLTCLFTDWERFEKTLPKLRAHEVKYIMVEGSLHKILSRCDPHAPKGRARKSQGIKPYKKTEKRPIHPNQVIGKVISILGRHQIPIIFAEEGRRQAEKMTLGILTKFWDEQINGGKNV